MRVTAKSVEVTNKGSIAANTFGAGDAGTIHVTAGSLRVTEGGRIESSTDGSGHGGNIEVQADQVTIAGAGPLPRRGDISVDTASSMINVNTGHLGGTAGNVRITAGSVHLLEGKLVSPTFGPGNGGTIDVRADQVLVAGEHVEIRKRCGVLAPIRGLPRPPLRPVQRERSSAMRPRAAAGRCAFGRECWKSAMAGGLAWAPRRRGAGQHRHPRQSGGAG